MNTNANTNINMNINTNTITNTNTNTNINTNTHTNTNAFTFLAVCDFGTLCCSDKEKHSLETKGVAGCRTRMELRHASAFAPIATATAGAKHAYMLLCGPLMPQLPPGHSKHGFGRFSGLESKSPGRFTFCFQNVI